LTSSFSLISGGGVSSRAHENFGRKTS
jgi:hypothetical protein